MIINFFDERAAYIYEGGLAGVPAEVALAAKSFLHILDSQGIDACLLTYDDLISSSGNARRFRLPAGWHLRFIWHDQGADIIEMTA